MQQKQVKLSVYFEVSFLHIYCATSLFLWYHTHSTTKESKQWPPWWLNCCN